MYKVHMHAIIELLCVCTGDNPLAKKCVCTGDNPLAKASGLSPVHTHRHKIITLTLVGYSNTVRHIKEGRFFLAEIHCSL